MKKNSARRSPKKTKEKAKSTKKTASEKIDTKVPVPEPKPERLVPLPISKDELKEKNDEKQKKINELFADADKESKYDFNLHKHLKENLKFRDKQCKDVLTKETLYCLECKISTCPQCPLFKIHNGHPLIKKYPYYVCDDKLINENFTDIDNIIKLNPDFLDSKKVKEELKNHVNDNLDILQNKLNEIKKSKMKELDNMFEKTEGCVEILKKKIVKIREDIKIFLINKKSFYALIQMKNQI